MWVSLLLLPAHGGFRKQGYPFLGGSYIEDCSILGFVRDTPPYFGKCPQMAGQMALSRQEAGCGANRFRVSGLGFATEDRSESVLSSETVVYHCIWFGNYLLAYIYIYLCIPPPPPNPPRDHPNYPKTKQRLRKWFASGSLSGHDIFGHT